MLSLRPFSTLFSSSSSAIEIGPPRPPILNISTEISKTNEI